MAPSLPRKNFARIPVKLNLPDLIEVQLDSFERLKREGLADLFHEVSPIESYNKGMKLYLVSKSAHLPFPLHIPVHPHPNPFAPARSTRGIGAWD